MQSTNAYEEVTSLGKRQSNAAINSRRQVGFESAASADRPRRGLADREIGIQHSEFSIPNSGPLGTRPHLELRPLPTRPARPGGIPVAPLELRVPATAAAPEPISVADYTERIRAGWVPVMGLPGTPITSGFVRDLGEYNPKLEGIERHLDVSGNAARRRPGGRNAARLQAAYSFGAVANVPGDDAGIGQPGLGTGRVGSNGRIRRLPTPTPTPTQFPAPARAQTADKAKEVADFIRDNFFSGLEWQDHRGSWHTQNWKDVVRCALRMQDFGAACYEEVMAIDGDRIRLRRMADRQALTFYRWHTDPHVVDPSLPPFVYDDGETLYALEQWGYRANRFEYVLLPTDKACIFTHEQEGANFWGIPLTRAMYPHWFVKKHLERIDAIACERNSLGVPMIMLPPNPSRQDVQTAQNWVTQLAAHEKTGLSLPNGAEFKLVGIEGRIREILPSMQYHKQQIATSCLAMFMELGPDAKRLARAGRFANRFLHAGHAEHRGLHRAQDPQLHHPAAGGMEFRA